MSRARRIAALIVLLLGPTEALSADEKAEPSEPRVAPNAKEEAPRKTRCFRNDATGRPLFEIPCKERQQTPEDKAKMKAYYESTSRSPNAT